MAVMPEDYLDVPCGHCGRVLKVEPRGATQLELRVIGGQHRMSYTIPSGSLSLPLVIDDGGISDVELQELA